jgi:biopolymer transport protein ExbD
MNRTSEPARSTAVPHINVTPLIDVLLVLLIIFMVLTPLRPARFKAQVPQQPADTPQNVLPHPWMLVVTLDGQGRLKLNQGDVLGTPNDMSRLAAQLARTFRERAGVPLPPGLTSARTVFVKAPRSARYGEVARVLDGLRGAGADPIGLQIDDLAQ